MILHAQHKAIKIHTFLTYYMPIHTKKTPKNPKLKPHIKRILQLKSQVPTLYDNPKVRFFRQTCFDL